MPSKSKKKDKSIAVAAATGVSVEERSSTTFFWKSTSPYSQWHASNYTLVIDNTTYRYICAEQGMMHGKALLFGDEEVAEQILAAASPREMKALGRLVRGFDESLWKMNREDIVYRNSVAKFTQNRLLCQALLDCSGDLVEASPYDRIWGIGLAEADARKMDRDKWPGYNLLGRILTRVRKEIQQGMHELSFGDDLEVVTLEED